MEYINRLTWRLRNVPNVVTVVSAAELAKQLNAGWYEGNLKWRGLLNAEHEPGDARHMKMSLTDAGRQLAEKTVPFAEQISELTFGDLKPEERAELIKLVRRISGMDTH